MANPRIKKLAWPLGLSAPPFSRTAAEWNAAFSTPALVVYWPALDEDVAVFTQTRKPAFEDASGLLAMIDLEGVGEVSLSRVLVRNQHLVFGVEPEGGWIEQVVYVETPTYSGLAHCDDETMDEYGTLPGDGEPPADYDYDDEEQSDEHARLSDSWVVYPIPLGLAFKYFCVRAGSMRATTQHEKGQYDWRVAAAARRKGQR
jgi:hypothetical protein